VREIPVDFPEQQTQHDVLATLWARTRVADLLSQDFDGAQRGSMKPELKETITQLGLEFRLMTQFTSFVAVEEMVVTDHGQPRRIDVPVEVPEGVNRKTAYGDIGMQFFAGRRQGAVGNISGFTLSSVSAQETVAAGTAKPRPAQRRRASSASAGGGAAGGISEGSGAGIGSGSASSTGGGSAGGGAGAPANMTSNIKAAAVDELLTARMLSPEEQKQLALQAKLHHSIRAIIDRLNAKTAAAPLEAEFIHDGKAEIQIWLTDKSDETLAALNKLGFEIVLDPKTAKILIGRLPVEKLAALAELPSVRYIAPDLAITNRGEH